MRMRLLKMTPLVLLNMTPLVRQIFATALAHARQIGSVALVPLPLCAHQLPSLKRILSACPLGFGGSYVPPICLPRYFHPGQRNGVGHGWAGCMPRAMPRGTGGRGRGSGDADRRLWPLPADGRRRCNSVLFVCRHASWTWERGRPQRLASGRYGRLARARPGRLRSSPRL